MKWFQWTASPSGRRVLSVLLVLLVLSMAMNPDLLPLLSLIDAVGLDVLLWLLGLQFVSFLAPMSALMMAARRLLAFLALPSATVAMAEGSWLQLRQAAAWWLPRRLRQPAR